MERTISEIDSVISLLKVKGLRNTVIQAINLKARIAKALKMSEKDKNELSQLKFVAGL